MMTIMVLLQRVGRAAATLGLAVGLGVPPAHATELVGWAADGDLVVFDSARPAAARRVAVEGIDGVVIGIDYRPRTNEIYAVTEEGDVFVLDVDRGRARFASRLTRSYSGDARSAVDFTPMADRLRILSWEGDNYRVHVEVGATAIDSPLRYEGGDPAHGARPRACATAYTRNVPRTMVTEMFNLDCARGTLVIQEPPNDGLLRTVGSLGVPIPSDAGFEIVSGPGGEETAFASFGGVLHRIDLRSGRASVVGTIGDGRRRIVGLAVAPSSEGASSGE